MTRCECDRADLDDGDQCWQCSLDDDLARYERSVVSIAEMRRRVDSQYITADNVDPSDPSVEADSEAESGTSVTVSYVWAFNGRLHRKASVLQHDGNLPAGYVWAPLVTRGGRTRPLRPLIDNGDGTLGVVLNDGNIAIVDAEVRDIVEPFNWSARVADGITYAFRRSKAEGTVYLHRWLMALTPEDDVEVDHINSNTLDCRRLNMRIATRTQNARHIRSHRGSSSNYVGVSWHRASSSWRVNVGSQLIGHYASEVDAARARDEAARDLFGIWPVINLPPCPACGWPAPDHALDCPDHYRLPH